MVIIQISSIRRKLLEIRERCFESPIGDKYKCKYCAVELSRSSSCSTYIRHISHHGFSVEEKSNEDDSEVEKLDDDLCEKANILLAQSLCVSYIPFNFVENKQFKEFCEIISENKYKSPSRSSIKRKIDQIYEDNFEDIIDKCKEADSICLTIDFWSSSHDRYLGIKGILINSSFQKKVITLACQEFNDNHTGPNICERLAENIEMFGIDADKMNYIVTDNGADLGCGIDLINDLYSNMKQITCAAHNLHLCITSSLDNVELRLMLNSCRKVCSFFSMSILRQKALLASAEMVRIESPTIPSSDSTTRYYKMVVYFGHD